MELVATGCSGISSMQPAIDPVEPVQCTKLQVDVRRAIDLRAGYGVASRLNWEGLSRMTFMRAPSYAFGRVDSFGIAAIAR